MDISGLQDTVTLSTSPPGALTSLSPGAPHSSSSFSGTLNTALNRSGAVAQPVQTVLPATPPTEAVPQAPAIRQFNQDLMQLFSAVSNGDTGSARSAYHALTGLSGIAECDSGSASTTDSPQSKDSVVSEFDTLLTRIGSALRSDNISSAQNALNDFLQNFSSLTVVDATA